MIFDTQSNHHTHLRPSTSNSISFRNIVPIASRSEAVCIITAQLLWAHHSSVNSGGLKLHHKEWLVVMRAVEHQSIQPSVSAHHWAMQQGYPYSAVQGITTLLKTQARSWVTCARRVWVGGRGGGRGMQRLWVYDFKWDLNSQSQNGKKIKNKNKGKTAETEKGQKWDDITYEGRS